MYVALSLSTTGLTVPSASTSTLLIAIIHPSVNPSQRVKELLIATAQLSCQSWTSIAILTKAACLSMRRP